MQRQPPPKGLPGKSGTFVRQYGDSPEREHRVCKGNTRAKSRVKINAFQVADFFKSRVAKIKSLRVLAHKLFKLIPERFFQWRPRPGSFAAGSPP